MNEDFKICFVCTGNACRSPFAECVTRRLFADAGIAGLKVYSLGTLDWGENPRDADMAAVAREMGYEMTGITTPMTRDRLMAADVIIVFDERHRDAITRELDYSRWDRIVLFNRIAFAEGGNVDDPHYQTEAVYRRVAQHIEAGCRKLVENYTTSPDGIFCRK